MAAMTSTPPPPPPPQSPPPGGYGGAAAQPLSPSDEKLWATLTHVLGIFFGFIPALIVYLVLKDRGPFVREHSKTALNFQLTMLIGYVVGYILLFIVIGAIVLLAVGIVVIVFSIIAALAANRGENYSYPLTIKFIK
jgi:uncharacterized protein